MTPNFTASLNQGSPLSILSVAEALRSSREQMQTRNWYRIRGSKSLCELRGEVEARVSLFLAPAALLEIFQSAVWIHAIPGSSSMQVRRFPWRVRSPESKNQIFQTSKIQVGGQKHKCKSMRSRLILIARKVSNQTASEHKSAPREAKMKYKIAHSRIYSWSQRTLNVSYKFKTSVTAQCLAYSVHHTFQT